MLPPDEYKLFKTQMDHHKTLVRKTKLRRIKEERICNNCGFEFRGRTESCDFHHPDGIEKEAYVTSMVQQYNKYTWQQVLDEIDKCIPLCANCHRTEHYGI